MKTAISIKEHRPNEAPKETDSDWPIFAVIHGSIDMVQIANPFEAKEINIPTYDLLLFQELIAATIAKLVEQGKPPDRESYWTVTQQTNEKD